MPGISYTLDADAAPMRRALEGARSSLAAFSSAVGSIASLGGLLGGLGAGAAALVAFKKALSGAAEIESMRTAFTVLLGSASGARELVTQLNAIGAATHLSVEGLSKAAKTMLSFGVAGEQVVPDIKMLGDVSGGQSQQFEALALAFSQTAAAGRLMGQDLLQYINAGFNPLQEISAKTGKSMMQLRKEVEAGSISFEQVQGAFRTATSEGGRFFGFTEAQAKTAAGLYAQLTNRISMLLSTFGAPINDALKPFLSGAVGLVNNMIAGAKEWGQAVGTAIGTFRNLIAGGELGTALGLSLQVGLGTAANYGIATFNALVESAGIGLGTSIASALDLLNEATTPAFWLGMGDAMRAIIIEIVSLFQRLMAGVLEKLASKGLSGTVQTAANVAAGVGVGLGLSTDQALSISAIGSSDLLSGMADGLRDAATSTQAAAAEALASAGKNLTPLWEKHLANMQDSWTQVTEAFRGQFGDVKDLTGMGDAAAKLQELLGRATPVITTTPDEKDRARPDLAKAAQALARPPEKEKALSDRLSKVGLFIGGAGGPQGEKSAIETALFSRKIFEELTKQTPLLDQITRQQEGVFTA